MQCEEVTRYEVAEALGSGITHLREEPVVETIREIVFEVKYLAVGLVGSGYTVTRVRTNSGKWRAAKQGCTRDKMIKWLSENGFEMARNPVRSKARTGTQFERHFWRKSLMGALDPIPEVERGVRSYGH
jgi:hypothetical protein